MSSSLTRTRRWKVGMGPSSVMLGLELVGVPDPDSEARGSICNENQADTDLGTDDDIAPIRSEAR